MIWNSSAQAFLSAGSVPNFHVAVFARPIDLTTGQRIDVGYWTGHEALSLSINGVERNMYATYGALTVDNPTYEPGTIVQSYHASMFGLSDEVDDLLKRYDADHAPVEAYQLVFSQGAEFKGYRRLLKGTIAKFELTIGRKGQGAKLEIDMHSSARSGTLTQTTKKSDASYKLRGGDTAMEYASSPAVDSDWWGARG